LGYEKKMTFMTRTTQSGSLVSLNDPGKDLTKKKPESEDNVDLLLSVLDDMNKLYETIKRLDYLLERTDINQFLCPKGKAEKK
jgi:hypothetical protein